MGLLRTIKKAVGLRVDFDFNDREFWREQLAYCTHEADPQKCLFAIYHTYCAELLKDQSPYYTWRVPNSLELPQVALDILQETLEGEH